MKARVPSTEIQYSFAAFVIIVGLVIAFSVIAGATMYKYAHKPKQATRTNPSTPQPAVAPTGRPKDASEVAASNKPVESDTNTEAQLPSNSSEKIAKPIYKDKQKAVGQIKNNLEDTTKTVTQTGNSVAGLVHEVQDSVQNIKLVQKLQITL